MKKSGRESYVVCRKLVMPDQINPNGTLFGGTLLSWIDQAAYMTAQKHSGQTFVVTVSMDQIVFHRPIHIGDHVILKSLLTCVGKTSMEIFVAVEREDGATGHREYATHAHVTFVALGPNAKPVSIPELDVQTEEETVRFKEGRVRKKIRKKISSWSEHTKTFQLLLGREEPFVV